MPKCNAQGVSISTLDGDSQHEADSVDSGFQLAITVNGAGIEGSGFDETGIRKKLTCQYFSENQTTWSSRGVFLRGIDVFASKSNGIDIAAICVSTHLTLFTVTDKGDATQLLESKVNVRTLTCLSTLPCGYLCSHPVYAQCPYAVQTLTSRFDALGTVDLSDAETTFNPLVPSIFAGLTLAFVTLIVVSRCKGRAAAVREARGVFAQLGRLARPSVVGGDEFEAILRGHVSAGSSAKMIALQILSVNPFLALFFTWSHEHIVFTQVDKAYILYGGILTSFLVQAFLFDGETIGQEKDVGDVLLNTLIGALFANTILFPVQYFLPYMIANVNSISTSTKVRRSLVQQQVNVLKKSLCGKGTRNIKKKKHLRSMFLVHFPVSLYSFHEPMHNDPVFDKKNVQGAFREKSVKLRNRIPDVTTP